MRSTNVVFTGKDQVEVGAEDVPAPGAGEYLVRARASLVSTGTELTCLGRRFDPGTHWDAWVQYPFRPGYSLVGEVVEAGPDAPVPVGARVALRRPHAELTLVAADERAHVLPDGVSDEEAAWFHLATIVQNGVRAAEHRLGDVVVVVGLGLLGQLAVQYARLLGAAQVIAVDPAAQRLEHAAAHGATTTVAAGVDEAAARVRDLTDGRGADVVYDVTGAAAVFGPALGLLRDFGRLVLLGDAGSPAGQRLTPDLITRGLTVVGAHDMHGEFGEQDRQYWNNLRQGELFLRYVERGDLVVSDLVTHRYPATDAADAYAMLQTDRSSALGVVFDWSKV